MNITSTSGVLQGDPLSSYFFALGMNSVLIQVASNFPSAKTLAYLNDLFILTNKNQNDKRTSVLVEELAAISLDLNQEKTEILSLPLGGEILGCFFGNCTTNHISKSQDSLTESIHLTRHVDIQSVLLVIRYCINSRDSGATVSVITQDLATKCNMTPVNDNVRFTSVVHAKPIIPILM
ncbi:hypothetical protein GEMRC1_012830 [Eukaryota sp. GEM-RC1]